MFQSQLVRYEAQRERERLGARYQILWGLVMLALALAVPLVMDRWSWRRALPIVMMGSVFVSAGSHRLYGVDGAFLAGASRVVFGIVGGVCFVWNVYGLLTE